MVAAPSRRSPRLCLTCRTPLGDGEPCDGGLFHDVVSLADAAGRARAIGAVWPGAPPAPTAARRALPRVLAGAGALAVVAVVCSSAFELAAMLAPASTLVGIWAERRCRRLTARARPLGVRSGPRLRGRGRPGTVVAGVACPPTSAPCAVGVILSVGTTHDVTLRDAWGFGFEVALDDGDRVRVPPGRVRIGHRSAQARPLSHAEAKRHLERIEPVSPRDGARARTVFPFDRACVVEIRVGDRLEIVGDLEPEQRRGGGAYRTPAGRFLVPAGVPRLRFTPGSRAPRR